MRKIMSCLDVGSDTIKLIVGESLGKKLNILAVTEKKADGIENGLVKDINKFFSSLRSVFSECGSIIGLPIKKTIISVVPHNTIFKVAEASMKIENDNGLISGSDVSKVCRMIYKKYRIENLEGITFMPTLFSLDGNREVKDPKGLTSKVLGVKGVLTMTPQKNIYPIFKCLQKLDVEIVDILLSPIGDYYEFRNKEMDRNGVALINIGAQNIILSYFNKGIITNVKTIQYGGVNIDLVLSERYDISLDDAKYLKEKSFFINNNSFKDSKISLNNIYNEEIVIDQQDIIQIIKMKLEQMIDLCKKEINLLTKREIRYIIFTGGVSEIRDLGTILEEKFDTKIVNIRSMKEFGVRHNKYSCAVGLLKYYAKQARFNEEDYSIFTLEEQQKLSAPVLDIPEESKIAKLFGYMFNG